MPHINKDTKPITIPYCDNTYGKDRRPAPAVPENMVKKLFLIPPFSRPLKLREKKFLSLWLDTK